MTPFTPKIFTPLTDFLAQDLPKPERTFVELVLPATVGIPRLTLAALAIRVRGKRGVSGTGAYHGAVNRLSEHFRGPALNLRKVADRYVARVSQYTLANDGEGSLVVVDDSDLQKAWTNQSKPGAMQGISRVRDGSRSRPGADVTGNGHLMTSIEVMVGGRHMPLLHLLHDGALSCPFFGQKFDSHAMREYACFEFAAKHVGKRAWWVFDRGYAKEHYFDRFDQNQLRWLVRFGVEGVVARRWLCTPEGVTLRADEAANLFKPTHVVVTDKRDRLRVALAHVYLGQEAKGQLRTLFVGWFGGAKHPFVLLASEALPLTQATAEWMRTTYRKRWKVEVSHRFLKASDGTGCALETFRTRTFLSTQRLVLMASMALGCVELVQLEASPTMQAQLDRLFPLSAKKATADLRGQVNAQVADAMTRLLPAAWRRAYPARLPAPKTPEERLVAAQKRLAQLAKEERADARRAESRTSERARLEAKFGK